MRSFKQKITIVGAMTLFSLMTAGCSIQEDIMRLDMRLATVENTQADLARRLDERLAQSGQQDDQLRSQYAENSAVISSLRSDLNRLGGRIDETEFALGRKLKEVDTRKDSDRLEARLHRIETYLDLEAEGPPPPATGTAGEAKLNVPVAPAPGPVVPAAPPQDPETLYQTAKRDFDRGALEEARAGFQRLLKDNPKAPNADNAQFWLGEIYYREQWYEKAILEYQKVIENYPKGNKIAASLLKQGLAFFNLGDKGNARLILKELIRKHPKSSEAQIAQQKVKGMD